MRSFIPRLVRLSAPFVLAFCASWAQASMTLHSLALDLWLGGEAQAPCPNTCGNAGTTLGWAFTVNSAIRINGLGVWDEGSNGLGTPLPVQAGLWTSAGTLLASVTVTDSSTAVASASPSGRWLFETIDTLTLDPGNYLIGSLFYPEAPLTTRAGGELVTIDIFVTGGQASSLDGDTGFMAPLVALDEAIYGSTMRLAPAAAVPEPGSLLLVAAAGLALLATRRRAA